MPAYHRLDLGINFTKEKKRGIRTWNLGLYNACCHMNPIMVEVLDAYDKQGNYIGKKAYSYGMFPIIPSFSWKFKFN